MSNMDLLNLIEEKFGEKAAGAVATVVGFALLAFFIWLLFVPNGVCECPCVNEIDFFGGRGGNPQESYMDE